MKEPTREELRALVRQMDEGHKRADQIRREALRDMPYNWEDVDALLQLGDAYDGPPRSSEGIIEMQRCFMKAKNRIKSCDIAKWLEKPQSTTDEHR
ncbi:MAG: hypothetical protein WC655_04415 [Candidatus Hydrogenedentales bacterium]|jgi:hypothetical protein